LQLLLKAVTCQ